ncbi:MAG: hypothetical protein V1783_09465, partial [Bacteroidota bacterium]
TPAEQKTTAAFKLKSEEIKALRQSLKKTQDQLEAMRQEKFEHEKRNAVLENKQKNIFWIEFFKFVSAGGIGFATSYVFSNNVPLALSFGIPSIVIFIIALIASNK